MTDRKLIDYIKKSTEKGEGRDEIKKALIDAGWPQQDVESGIMEVSSTVNPVPVPGPVAKESTLPAAATGTAEKPKKKGHKRLIIALVVLFILIMLFVYVIAGILEAFTTEMPGGMNFINDILSGSAG